MDPIIQQYINIPDDPTPSRELSPPLPPMDEDVGSLRSIPDPDGDSGDRTTFLILRTDMDRQALSLGQSDQGMKHFPRNYGNLATHLNRVPCHVPFLSQTTFAPGSDFDAIPDLSPDSSPASVAPSEVLLTPGVGVSLADVETSPMIQPYIDDQVFGDKCTGPSSPCFDDLEDSLDSEATGYHLLDTMPEDIACQSTTMLVHSMSIISDRTHTRDTRKPHLLADIEQSETELQPHLSPQDTTAIRHPVVPVPVLGSVSPTYTAQPSPLSRPNYPPTTDAESGDVESVCDSTDPGKSPVLSPLLDIIGKRRRGPSSEGHGRDNDVKLRRPSTRSRAKFEDDDDDEYVPNFRQSKRRISCSPGDARQSRSSAAPSNKVASRGKRRGSRKSRAYVTSSSTPRPRCSHCRTTFSRAGDVERHQKSLACPVLRHEAEENGTLDDARWPCPICGDKLSRNDSQARHFDNTHPGVNPGDYGLKLRKRDGRP